jgi:Zinc carboxypeptidase
MRPLSERLPELAALEQLLPDLPGAQVRTLGKVQHGKDLYPIHAVLLGPTDPTLPTLLYTGGVHGLERVGTQTLLSYLRGLRGSLQWDLALKDMLTRMRLLFVPLVNPVGVAEGLRSNGRGVDLMRNAPVDADERSRWFELHRGQRITPLLPWFRGKVTGQLEREAELLCEFVKRELFPSVMAISLDVHSGFLAGDRIWFPYARTRKLFHGVPEVWALKELLAAAHENHVYTVEPQALNYTTHGDLWDYLYDEYLKVSSRRAWLPLTLEMSSYLWYRKNPRQLLSRFGLFHPVKPHRLERVQRRHKPLFDFLSRTVLSHEQWCPNSPEARATLLAVASERWSHSASEP